MGAGAVLAPSHLSRLLIVPLAIRLLCAHRKLQRWYVGVGCCSPPLVRYVRSRAGPVPAVWLSADPVIVHDATSIVSSAGPPAIPAASAIPGEAVDATDAGMGSCDAEGNCGERPGGMPRARRGLWWWCTAAQLVQTTPTDIGIPLSV